MHFKRRRTEKSLSRDLPLLPMYILDLATAVDMAFNIGFNQCGGSGRFPGIRSSQGLHDKTEPQKATKKLAKNHLNGGFFKIFLCRSPFSLTKSA